MAGMMECVLTCLNSGDNATGLSQLVSMEKVLHSSRPQRIAAGKGADYHNIADDVVVIDRCLINVGDGTQRYCSENRIKLSSVSCVVLSSLCPHNTSGFPSIFLALSDLGVGELTVVGPTGVRSLLKTMTPFINRKYPVLNVVEIDNHTTNATIQAAKPSLSFMGGLASDNGDGLPGSITSATNAKGKDERDYEKHTLTLKFSCMDLKCRAVSSSLNPNGVIAVAVAILPHWQQSVEASIATAAFSPGIGNLHGGNRNHRSVHRISALCFYPVSGYFDTFPSMTVLHEWSVSVISHSMSSVQTSADHGYGHGYSDSSSSSNNNNNSNMGTRVPSIVTTFVPLAVASFETETFQPTPCLCSIELNCAASNRSKSSSIEPVTSSRRPLSARVIESVEETIKGNESRGDCLECEKSTLKSFVSSMLYDDRAINGERRRNKASSALPSSCPSFSSPSKRHRGFFQQIQRLCHDNASITLGILMPVMLNRDVIEFETCQEMLRVQRNIQPRLFPLPMSSPLPDPAEKHRHSETWFDCKAEKVGSDFQNERDWGEDVDGVGDGAKEGEKEKEERKAISKLLIGRRKVSITVPVVSTETITVKNEHRHREHGKEKEGETEKARSAAGCRVSYPCRSKDAETLATRYAQREHILWKVLKSGKFIGESVDLDLAHHQHPQTIRAPPRPPPFRPLAPPSAAAAPLLPPAPQHPPHFAYQPLLQPQPPPRPPFPPSSTIPLKTMAPAFCGNDESGSRSKPVAAPPVVPPLCLRLPQAQLECDSLLQEALSARSNSTTHTERSRNFVAADFLRMQISEQSGSFSAREGRTPAVPGSDMFVDDAAEDSAVSFKAIPFSSSIADCSDIPSAATECMKDDMKMGGDGEEGNAEEKLLIIVPSDNHPLMPRSPHQRDPLYRNSGPNSISEGSEYGRDSTGSLSSAPVSFSSLASMEKGLRYEVEPYPMNVGNATLDSLSRAPALNSHTHFDTMAGQCDAKAASRLQGNRLQRGERREEGGEGELEEQEEQEEEGYAASTLSSTTSSTALYSIAGSKRRADVALDRHIRFSKGTNIDEHRIDRGDNADAPAASAIIAVGSSASDDYVQRPIISLLPGSHHRRKHNIDTKNLYASSSVESFLTVDGEQTGFSSSIEFDEEDAKKRIELLPPQAPAKQNGGENADAFNVTFLGTGCATPSKYRNNSSIMLRIPISLPAARQTITTTTTTEISVNNDIEIPSLRSRREFLSKNTAGSSQRKTIDTFADFRDPFADPLPLKDGFERDSSPSMAKEGEEVGAVNSSGGRTMQNLKADDTSPGRPLMEGVVLLDVGDGTSAQLFQSVGGDSDLFYDLLLRIRLIWISHHHADHICGLPMLLEHIQKARNRFLRRLKKLEVERNRRSSANTKARDLGSKKVFASSSSSFTSSSVMHSDQASGNKRSFNSTKLSSESCGSGDASNQNTSEIAGKRIRTSVLPDSSQEAISQSAGGALASELSVCSQAEAHAEAIDGGARAADGNKHSSRSEISIADMMNGSSEDSSSDVDHNFKSSNSPDIRSSSSGSNSSEEDEVDVEEDDEDSDGEDLKTSGISPFSLSHNSGRPFFTSKYDPGPAAASAAAAVTSSTRKQSSSQNRAMVTDDAAEDFDSAELAKLLFQKILVIAPENILQYYEFSACIAGLDDLVMLYPIHATLYAGIGESVCGAATGGAVTCLKSVPVLHCQNSYGVVLDLHSGHRIVYSGDCRPSQSLVKAVIAPNPVAERNRNKTLAPACFSFNGNRSISTASGRCDLLIHEATFDDTRGKEAVRKKHSTISEAVEISKRMRAKNTIITHFSQRYPIGGDTAQAASMNNAMGSGVRVVSIGVGEEVRMGADTAGDRREISSFPPTKSHLPLIPPPNVRSGAADLSAPIHLDMRPHPHRALAPVQPQPPLPSEPLLSATARAPLPPGRPPPPRTTAPTPLSGPPVAAEDPPPKGKFLKKVNPFCNLFSNSRSDHLPAPLLNGVCSPFAQYNDQLVHQTAHRPLQFNESMDSQRVKSKTKDSSVSMAFDLLSVSFPSQLNALPAAMDNLCRVLSTVSHVKAQKDLAQAQSQSQTLNTINAQSRNDAQDQE